MNIGEIARITGASTLHLSGADLALPVLGASIDSRKVKPGDLFVCLPGERCDGHEFAAAASRGGAALILASRKVEANDTPVLMVDNPEKAFQKIAAYWRSLFRGKVIALTGTAGKTTLKEMLKEIIKLKGETACTEGNHNNQLGLPLTILNTTGSEDFWILEVGISHPGDMELLGEIAQPDMAVILNTGPGHTEGLGEKGVAWHKTRLLNYLRPGGMAILNADYPDLVSEAASFDIPIVWFGTHKKPLSFSIQGDPGEGYTLALDKATISLPATFPGAYMGETILCAATVATCSGAGREAVIKGIASTKQPPHRFNLRKTGGLHIFDDTYNANPFSMAKMLDAAASHAAARQLPLLLVLGEMGELGSDAEEQHFKLGRKLAELQAYFICFKGAHADAVHRGLLENGSPHNFHSFENLEDFAKLLPEIKKNLRGHEAVILFKGSRVNMLERELEHFCQNITAEAGRAHVL